MASNTSTKTEITINCLLVVAFLGFMAVQFTDGLLCYQCGDAKLDSPCYHDYEGLTNTSKGWNVTYKKNCTDSNPRWDRCFIETHRRDGKVLIFQRGCHDGVTFNKKNKDVEFQNLSANNESTCSYVTDRLICFRFCQDNYCNGPQPIYDECDLKNTTEREVCAGIGIHDNGLTTLFWNTLMVLVVCGFTYNHRWG